MNTLQQSIYIYIHMTKIGLGLNEPSEKAVGESARLENLAP